MVPLFRLSFIRFQVSGFRFQISNSFFSWTARSVAANAGFAGVVVGLDVGQGKHPVIHEKVVYAAGERARAVSAANP
jgi:hypothetical protein